MVSLEHEILVDLFKNRPSLAAELLTEILGVPLPRYDKAELKSAELNEIKPAEYRADLLIHLSHRNKLVRVIIVEVQLRIDPDKPFAWPAYLANARHRYRCPVDLLIVAPHPKVARWCARPIELGTPGFVLCPPVLHKKLIPLITDPSEAKRRVELAMLSVMAHGRTKMGATLASVLMPALKDLSEEKAGFYHDIMLNSLNEVARLALEEMMKGYVYQSDFAKKYYGQGRSEGRSEGRVEEAARALLTVLRLRGIPLSEEERTHILNQKDPSVLELWHERAVVASSLAEVFQVPH